MPRKDIGPLTIALVLIAATAWMMSPALLLFVPGGEPSAARALRTVKEGGIIWMGLVLLLDVLVPIALAILGAQVLRGKRVPPVLFLIAPSLPFAVGLLGSWVGQIMTFGAINGESIDPGQKLRIMAEGMGEARANDVLSGFVTCGCAIVACVGAASAAASIDANSSTAEARRRGLLGVVIVGGGWLCATTVLMVLRLRTAGPLVALPVLAVATLLPFAILAARGASVLRQLQDRTEATRVLATIAVAALAASLGLVAFERATEASFSAVALKAISGESVDPSQQPRILFEALDAQRFSSAALLVHGVFGLATFTAALMPGLGGSRHPLTLGAVAAPILGIALVIAVLGVGRSRANIASELRAHTTHVAPAGVTLPTIRRTFSSKAEGAGSGTPLAIAADGTVLEKGRDPLCKSGDVRFRVYADRTLTVAALANVLTQQECEQPELVFVSKRDHDPAVDARLGELAAYLGTTAYVEARVTRAPYVLDAVEVRSIGDDVIEVDGKRASLPLSALEIRTSPQAVRFTFRPTDTVERMLGIITSVREALPSPSISMLADLGMAVRNPLPNAVTRHGTPQVKGGLSREIVASTARQSRDRFRLCYENGLRKKSDLAGRVVVKFVIDRRGAVTSAEDGGSELTDEAVVACFVDTFNGMSFPLPDGGTVTVIYPIHLSPND